jgi:hypothetical protein
VENKGEIPLHAFLAFGDLEGQKKHTTQLDGRRTCIFNPPLLEWKY